MKRGTASRVFLGGNKVNDDFGGLLLLSQVILGKKSGMFTDHTGLYITDNVMLGKGIARVITAVVHGTSPLSLPDAIADSLSYVKAFGGTEQRNLPDGYTQLEYIESSGTQYIDPDVSGNARWVITAQANAVKGSSQSLISSSPSASGGTWYGEFTSTGHWDIVSGGTNIPPTTKTTADLTFDGNGARGTIGSTSVDRVVSVTQGTWRIFATTGGGTRYPFAGKLFDAKVYQNGTLVRDFVPAKNSSGVIGMYDIVNDVFYENAGTDTFAAGPTVVPTPDTPMDIVCNNGVLKVSRNLFDKTTYIAGKYYNSSGNIIENPDYGMSGFIPMKSGQTFAVSGRTPSGIAIFNTSQVWQQQVTGQSFTAPYDGYFVVSVAAGQQDTLQVEFGSTATPYMPYGQIYTDGTVETINVHGKNLFDQSTATRYRTSWSTGGDGSWQEVSSSTEAVCYGSYVKPNTTYTLSKKGGNRLIITGYRTKTEPSSSATPADYKIQTNITEIVDGSYTFTTPADCTWILFGLRNNNSTPTFPYDVQLEQGSAATEYAPYYNGGTATAEMLLKIGDYQDVQSIIDGVVTRKVGIKVLDGTENWDSTSTAGLWLLRNVVATVLPSTCICTHFLGVSTTTSGLDMPDLSIRYGVTGYNDRLYIRHSSLASVDGLKQILANQYNAGTPVIVVYPLATETTESVTGQTLQVQAGDNTLEITQASLSNLELEAEYQKREQ